MALTQVKAGGLIADAIDETKLADDSIDSEHYNAASIDNEHLADDAVGIDELSATGTAGNTTYLRGDNTWTVPPDTNTVVGGATGVDFNDGVKARWGTGNDLEIYHDASGGNHSYIMNTGAGVFKVGSDTQFVIGKTGPETYIECNPDGNVELYYDNAKKFETTSIGAKVSSDSTAYLQIVGGEGGSACLALTPDESDDNADEVRLITNDGGATYLQNKASGGWETNLLSQPNGNIEFYYDNAKKAETVTGGFTVTGTCTATSFAGDGSNLTGISGGISSDSNDNVVGGDNAGTNISGSGNQNTCIGDNAGSSITDGDNNVAIGYYALDGVTTTNENVAVGSEAGQAITGADNVAIGFRAAEDATSINSCVAIGAWAYDGANTGDANVAIGEAAMGNAVTTGGNNVAIGKGAADGLTSANEIVAIGRDCMGGGTVTGSENVGVGDNALYDLSSGINNTAVGRVAATNITTGSGNTALGKSSLHNNAQGNNNVAVGYDALYTAVGHGNVAVGYQALKLMYGNHYSIGVGYQAGLNATGSQNVFMGAYAGDANTTAANQVIIGYNAGSAVTDGGSCVYVGASAGHAATGEGCVAIGSSAWSTGNTGTNSVMIGNLTGQYKTGASLANTAVGAYAFRGGSESEGNTCLGMSSGAVISTGDNNVCVGRSAGSYITEGGNNIFIGYGTGMLGSPTGVYNTDSNTLSLGNNSIDDFYCAETSISSSDKRDKTDIEEWTHGLSYINKLKPVTYRWDKRSFYSSDYSITPDGSKKKLKKHLGFLAQDVLEVEKGLGYAGSKQDMLAVNLNLDDSAYGMKYERLVVVLTKAVQELSAKNDALEARIAALEAA